MSRQKIIEITVIELTILNTIFKINSKSWVHKFTMKITILFIFTAQFKVFKLIHRIINKNYRNLMYNSISSKAHRRQLWTLENVVKKTRHVIRKYVKWLKCAVNQYAFKCKHGEIVEGKL